MATHSSVHDVTKIDNGLNFDDDPNCYCLLAPHEASTEAQKLLSWPENQKNVATVAVRGPCPSPVTVTRAGHVVNLAPSASGRCRFLIGSGDDDDLHLPRDRVERGYLEIFIRSYDDHESAQDFSVMLRRKRLGDVQICDPFELCPQLSDDPFSTTAVKITDRGPFSMDCPRVMIIGESPSSECTDMEMMCRQTRCINRMSLLRIHGLTYSVHYPLRVGGSRATQDAILWSGAEVHSTSDEEDYDGLGTSMRVQCYLHKGPHGVIRLVRSSQSGRQYARKEIKIGRIDNVELLRRQLESVNNLHHVRSSDPFKRILLTNKPNVLPATVFSVLDSAMTDESGRYVSSVDVQLLIYMPVMECSLATALLIDPPPVPWHEVLLGVAEGLAYLHHERKLIHRYLTPYNILLLRRPDGSTKIKISDVGVSNVVRERSDCGFNDLPSYYSAPEVLRNRSKMTASADVWSFGAVMVNALAPKDFAELCQNTPVKDCAGGGWANALSQLVATLHLDELGSWLEAMLSIDKLMRPRASELVLLLRSIQSEEKTPVLKDVFSLRAPPYVQRRPRSPTWEPNIPTEDRLPSYSTQEGSRWKVQYPLGSAGTGSSTEGRLAEADPMSLS